MDFLLLTMIVLFGIVSGAYIWPALPKQQTEDIAYTHGSFAFVLARLRNG